MKNKSKYSIGEFAALALVLCVIILIGSGFAAIWAEPWRPVLGKIAGTATFLGAISFIIIKYEQI